MNDAPSNGPEFYEDDLTDEERAILHAFDAANLDDLAASENTQDTILAVQPARDEDLRSTFIEEVAGDCTELDRILQHERDTRGARAVQRIAHKLKGTCGAMDCIALATIALHLETLAKRIEGENIDLQSGWQALERGCLSLALTLEEYATRGRESSVQLDEFEDECRRLGIDLHAPGAARPRQSTYTPLLFEHTARVDRERIETLHHHAENLAMMGIPLAEAQLEVEQAIQELHAAEERLRRLELRLTVLPTNQSALDAGNNSQRDQQDSRSSEVAALAQGQATSSLIARILSEAARRTGRLTPRSPAPAASTSAALDWDELEIDRFKEDAVLAFSLGEAIADVSIASSHLRIAFAHLSRLFQEQSAQSIAIHDNVQLLHLTTASYLFRRVAQEVQAAAVADQPTIQFEVRGETTELDQRTIEQLGPALLRLIQTGLDQLARAAFGAESPPPRLWLEARAAGSFVMLEVGFSLPVESSVLTEIDDIVRALGGTLALRRAETAGVIYALRLPRSCGTLHALIVRVGHYSFAVPFAQVQQVMPASEERTMAAVSLRVLLGLPPEPQPRRPPASLSLAGDERHESLPFIHIEEVLGDTRLIIKQLPLPLRRPGISGAAIDGSNNVLPVLDLLELLRHAQSSSAYCSPPEQLSGQEELPARPPTRARTVLVADDSISLRHTLRQLLSREHYEVSEARDGLDTLERLRELCPDALLLDIEMPNANGFDVLRLLRFRPELSAMKIIMLTSRLSDKHRARAFDLGAHAYLTKPCDQETLLETLRRVLAS